MLHSLYWFLGDRAVHCLGGGKYIADLISFIADDNSSGSIEL